MYQIKGTMESPQDEPYTNKGTYRALDARTLRGQGPAVRSDALTSHPRLGKYTILHGRRTRNLAPRFEYGTALNCTLVAVAGGRIGAPKMYRAERHHLLQLPWQSRHEA